jgi:1-deoxy-D-xylulose-5-phosphate synthase
MFDIALISNIPNIVYLAPTNKEEYLAILDWAVNKNNKYPVAIRMLSTKPKSIDVKDDTDYSILNKFKVVRKGKKVAIIAAGSFYELGEKVADRLFEKYKISVTLINPCYISGLDKELLENLKKDHQLVITLESGIIEGGFGQKIASFYGNSNIKVLNRGADKEFVDYVSHDELWQRYRLKPSLIAEDVIKNLRVCGWYGISLFILLAKIQFAVRTAGRKLKTVQKLKWLLDIFDKKKLKYGGQVS